MRNSLTSAFIIILALAGLATTAHAGWDEGVAAFKAGNYQQAANEFQAFVDERPDVFQGHYMLGQVLMKLGKNKEAVEHLRKAYEIESANVGVQLALGTAYLGSGRYADAVAMLGKIDSSALPAAQQSALHQMMAVALDKSGDSDRAYAELGKAVKANPNSADLQFQYGTSALRAGDTQVAVSALGKAVGMDAGDPEKQRAYAQALIKQGRMSAGSAKMDAYAKAAGAAQRVVAANADFDNLMLLGSAQLGAKQYDEAIGTFQQAAGKNSTDWLPPYYLGQAYTVKDQFRSAEAALRQALDKAPQGKDQVTIWKQLGFVYEKQKKYAEAVAAYERAGDSGSVTRVKDNQQTAEYNQSVEQEAEELRRLREEEERLKKELEDLQGGKPPGR